MKKLYALFIAIDEYAIPHHNLSGCVNDMTAMQQFLKRYAAAQDWEFLPEIITNQNATRENIIKGFDHFRAAKNEDVCFFFYSGHGSQQVASPEFWTNANGMNESIVCHDSRLKGGRDLMDKELGYLIWEATKNKDIHFLSIMDCCHSGSATRKLAGSRKRNIHPNPMPFSIEDYLGYQYYQKENGKVNPPDSRHTHLAACRDYETAKEQNFGGHSRGVFTYSLLENLEKGGVHQSYLELMQRTRIRMQQLAVQQHPLLEGKDNDLSFLGQKKVKGVPNLVFFEEDEEEWMIDIGGMQGIREEQDLTLVLEDKSELKIIEVRPQVSLVSGMEGKDRNQQFEAWLQKDSKRTFSLHLHESLGEKLKEKIRIKLDEVLTIQWNKEESTALFAVKMYKNSLILVRSGEDTPLFRRVPIVNLETVQREKNINDFRKAVLSVTNWEYVLAMQNPYSEISSKELEITVTVFDHPKKIKPHHDKKTILNPMEPVILNHLKVVHKGAEKWKGQVWEVTIANQSEDQTYWINAAYLEANFGINNALNFEKLIRLEPGNSTALQYTAPKYSKIYSRVQCGFDKSFLSWGINEISEYLKIFVSTQQINKFIEHQLPLNLDLKGQPFGGGRNTPPDEDLGEDWTSFNIEFKIKHPFTEVELTENTPNELQNLTISCPKGFSGKASLTNLNEVTRNLNCPLPSHFWEKDKEGIMPITRGTNQSDGLEVLEIIDCQNAAAVTAENPMKLQFEGQKKEEEIIIPWGIDAETGLFYPVGTSDENGEVLIQNLPSETSTQRTRSLGGSIKIFFQKLLRITYKHPLLQQAEVNENEELTYLEKDLPAIKETIIKGDEVQNIAIFIHGIVGDTKEMTKSVRRVQLPDGRDLNAFYDLVLTFDYENLSTSIKETAKKLKIYLEKAGLGENHGHTVHVFAHSMGGLVSRWMIEKEGGDAVVSHLFQFGTPNGGSEWSNVQEMATLLLTQAINGAAFLQPYLIPLSLASRYLGKVQTTLEEMNPESDFLKDLNDGRKSPIPYTIINGNTQLIPAMMTAEKQNLFRRLLNRFKSRIHYDLLDILIFKNPNDIAVTIESQAKLNRGTDLEKKIIGCDHISYFVHPMALKAFEEIWAQRILSNNS